MGGIAIAILRSEFRSFSCERMPGLERSVFRQTKAVGVLLQRAFTDGQGANSYDL